MAILDVLDALGFVVDGTDLIRRRRGCWTLIFVFALLFVLLMIYLEYFRS